MPAADPKKAKPKGGAVPPPSPPTLSRRAAKFVGAKVLVPVVGVLVLTPVTIVVTKYVTDRTASQTTLTVQTAFGGVKCAGIQVAMPAGGQPIQAINFGEGGVLGQPGGLDADSVGLKHGAVPWRAAQLVVDLQTTGGADTLQITSVIAHVTRHEPAHPEWILDRDSGGCGGTYQRLYDLDLDEARPVLRDTGVQGGLDGEPTPVNIPTSAVGKSFTVSPSDPSEIVVNAKALKYDATFLIEVTYSTQGKSHTVQTGTFRMTGGDGPFYTPTYDDAKNSYGLPPSPAPEPSPGR